MFQNIIKKASFLKKLFYPSVVIIFALVTLAFIPHYSCACAGNEMKKKSDGSILSYHVKNISENIINGVKEIIK